MLSVCAFHWVIARKERVDVTTILPDASPENILSLSTEVERALIGEECERSICCGAGGGGAADIVRARVVQVVVAINRTASSCQICPNVPTTKYVSSSPLELVHHLLSPKNAQYNLSSQQCIRFYVLMCDGPLGGYHAHHLSVQCKPSRRLDYFFYKSVSLLLILNHGRFFY